ncbi:Reverse transcriptase [Camponotus japonicus]
MERLINIQNFMSEIMQNEIDPETLVKRAIGNLYSIENRVAAVGGLGLRNDIRAVIAFVKLLYDHGQRMTLARVYLLHRIKLMEVREQDNNMEISMLRGITPTYDSGKLSTSHIEADNILKQNSELNAQSKDSDDELEIILDTRMINDIDVSKAALHEISRRIEEKKEILYELDREIEDVTNRCFISVEDTSVLESEHFTSRSSDRVERTPGYESPKRSRVDGARYSSSIINEMDKSQDKEIKLLPQEELGASRGRQGGVPDTAGSPVHGRESCKGTDGAVSTSAPSEQAATVEHNLSYTDTCIYEELLEEVQETETPLKKSEKRKASTSPDNESEGITREAARRPNKTRIIESIESNIVLISDSEDHQNSDDGEYKEVYTNSYTDTEEEKKSATPGVRVTRAKIKEKGKAADFSQLKAERKKKMEKEEAKSEKYEESSTSFREDFINAVLRRESKYEERQKSDSVESGKSASDYEVMSETSSDKEERSNCQTSSKRSKTNKKRVSDRAQKYQGQKTRRKAAIPIIVSKEEAERDLQVSRQEWLDMDPAALGAKCLDHLAELDQQRARCSNISGRVAGRIKDSRIVAAEIVKAMVEKLTSTGDVFALKNENCALKEELSNIKHREEAQNKEIDSLRKLINNLQREVRSLKEGLGPYAATTKASPKRIKSPKEDKKKEVPAKKADKQATKDLSSPTMYSVPVQETSYADMDVEPLVGNTPGCSNNEKYMNRDQGWPEGAESIAWKDEEQDRRREEEDIVSNYNYNAQNNKYLKDRIELKSRYKYNEKVSTDNNIYTMYRDNYDINNKTSENYVINKRNKIDPQIEDRTRDKGIRIIENVQIVPPSHPIQDNSDWREVPSRRRQRTQRFRAPDERMEPGSQRQPTRTVREKTKPSKRFIKPAVVTITSKPDGLSYAQILAKAREKVCLKDLGIQTTTIRRAINGAIIIEVPGPQGKQLADSLRNNLEAVIGDDAKVHNPIAKGELRLRGIEPSTTQEEILMELEAISGLPRRDFKVSDIVSMKDGMGVTWIICPLQAAVKIAEKGVLTLGWTRVKIDLLKKRPIQCYKCWRYGHVQKGCRSDIDRTGLCFKCGSSGHNIGQCRVSFPNCLICKDIGCEASWAALDLLKQYMHEIDVTVAVISEPPKGLKESNQCFISDDKCAAILWRPESSEWRCRLINKGIGFVAIRLDDMQIVSCYISRNVSISTFLKYLDTLNDILTIRSTPSLICGDFNAHATMWNSRSTDRRGESIIDWTAAIELRLLNKGAKYTCIRPQGCSIIDLSWASSCLMNRVKNWSVLDDVETLSDHQYIEIILKKLHSNKRSKTPKVHRWNFRKLDEELFGEVLEFLLGAELPVNIENDPDEYADWIRKIMTSACNVAAPLVVRKNAKKQVYWWSEGVSRLRKEAIKERRRWYRSKRGNDPNKIKSKKENYVRAKKELRNEIRKAKSAAWSELIATIDKDPWGLPYKLIMGKIRRTNPTLSETLDEASLDRLLNSLFPKESGKFLKTVPSPLPSIIYTRDEEEQAEVNIAEMFRLVKKRPSKNVAPGPDNLKFSVWKKIPGNMLGYLGKLLTICFKLGIFPEQWKIATLVLIPKGTETIPEKVKARPICLLNEIGKIFERAIANRLNDWMDEDEIRLLSDNQFGFRRERSTIDAISRVREITQTVLDGNGFAIAVGIDIANAFNSIPWTQIKISMEEKGFPAYLRKIIESYLSARIVIYKNCAGRVIRRDVRAGVPQGSVLGPLLWNIAFDSVLRVPLEDGCNIVCYADDTLIIASSSSLFDTVVKSNIQIARVIHHIRGLGLTVAEDKTEAVLFCNKKPAYMPFVRVGRTDIPVGHCMRYLGVMIDGTWNFREHIKYTENKATKVVKALARVMPNLRGPGEKKRQLYATVVRSVVMYASPIWGEKFAASSDRITRPLRKLQRTIAIRTAAAYRTTSFDAITLIARSPPWKLEAAFRSRIYSRLQDLKRRSEYTDEAEAEIRKGEETLLLRQWEIILSGRNVWGAKTIKAIKPHMKRWIERRFGEVGYYTTQMFTGHGSFGHFLHRINKRETAECFHCSETDDTVEHTLGECPRWDTQRSELIGCLGLRSQDRISMEVIVGKMLDSEEYWKAFSRFAVSVLKSKEEEERRREKNSLSPIDVNVN